MTASSPAYSRGLATFVVAVAAAIVVGCADPGPRRHAIRGEVTLDGEPVDDATIVLTPDGEGLAAIAEIEDGEFRFSEESGPTSGEFGVRINPNEAEMEAVEDDPDQLAESADRQRIPAVYQRTGALTATISGDETQLLRFELSSQGR